MISQGINNTLTTLNKIPLNKGVYIVGVRLQGAERRRLMDLGLIPETYIVPELNSMMGEPRAYRVRGSLIALRTAQSEHILVREEA